jgi:hypothetical protein
LRKHENIQKNEIRLHEIIKNEGVLATTLLYEKSPEKQMMVLYSVPQKIKLKYWKKQKQENPLLSNLESQGKKLQNFLKNNNSDYLHYSIDIIINEV